MSADLQNPIFHDLTAAREALEAVRWPDGVVCPHCGNADQDRISLIEGTKKSHRPGLRYCAECKGQFTVTVGTVFERSKVPLTKWWLAVHLLGSSKKGMSSHQLHRMLGVTYKTAWFMTHRIREAMNDTKAGPMGGGGKVVEADETYFGRRETPIPSKQRKGRPYTKRKSPFDKRSVVALVERGAACVASTFSTQPLPTFVKCWCATSLATPLCIPMKAASTPRQAKSSRHTKQSSTPLASTSVALSTPTRSKTCFPYSSVA